MKLLLRIAALACALGFIMLSARARAESGAPPPPDEASLHVRRPTLPIPTNGVLVLERDDYADATIEVRDAEGALIEGTLREITRDAGELFVWAPASPLEEGTLTVTLGVLENPEVAEVVTIAVVAAFDSEPPVLRSAPSATWQATPQLDADYCCLTPLGEQSGCFFVLQDCSIRVQPGFSTAASVAVLNQYLFRVVPAGTPTTSTVPFHPFEDTHEVEFFAPADEYCIEIHAFSLATQLIHTYADLEGCASHEIKEVGHNISVEVEPQSLSIEQCLVPPPAFKSDWCEINSNACEGDFDESCKELYDYVCNDGPAPRWRDVDGSIVDLGPIHSDRMDAGIAAGSDAGDAGDAEVPAADPIDASFGPSAKTDGCSVTGKQSRGGSSLFALTLAIAGALLWMRRRSVAN